MKTCRMLWFVCMVSLLAMCGIAPAAEKYPSRQIEFVVPFGPGGSADIAARCYSDELSRILKVPITVVNRDGGGGIRGTDYVVRAKKDGYTLLQAASGSIVAGPILIKEATYSPLRDLIPLGHFAYNPSVIAVNSDSPFRTLEELMEYARKNPGKLKNAATGSAGASYFNLAILCSKTNIKITSIPFKSGGETVSALLGGHIELSSSSISTMGPQIKAEKLRGLAITSKTRHPDFPNVPTTAELGHPYVNFNGWFGVFAPAGVPQPVIDVLVPAFEKAFKNPEVAERANRGGFTVEYMGPEEFRKFIEAEFIITEEIARDANLIKK